MENYYCSFSILEASTTRSAMPAKVGDIVLLSIIFCHLSTFLLQVGFGGKSLLAAIINVAAFGEIFTGCPSGPATVIYFLGISADCKLFKTISCFSFGLCAGAEGH